MQDIKGKIVEEADVCKDLGFLSIAEFRRWQTNIGYENEKLKYALNQEKDQSSRFQYHGLKMQKVLDKMKEFLKSHESDEAKKILLAIEVVSGRGVDWENSLKGWFEDVVPSNR